MKMLVSWIGNTDLNAADGKPDVGIGPIAEALQAGPYNYVLLLADQKPDRLRKFEGWLRTKFQSSKKLSLKIERVELSSPINFDEIYTAVTETLDKALKTYDQRPELTFHLSPGTPAMAATWVVLGKTRYRAELIQTARGKGVEVASLPFKIAMSPEFFADILKSADQDLEGRSAGIIEDARQFGDIIYRSSAMERLVTRAKKAAPRSVPILIEGESGTGKELLARAIHEASTRSVKTLQVVNCGAIPSELVESELFGHVKGSFTGAAKDHDGFFEAADGGTLFLDEIGELPLAAQVKLLRALQEGEIRRVGDSKTKKVNVRVIAATNRDLAKEVSGGRFREDLFYRLAVLVIKAPPLREREEDIAPLVDGLLARINDQSEAAGEPGFKRKKISSDARKFLMHQTWPGNIRELENTLRRAAVWSDGEVLELEDVKDAILPTANTKRLGDEILNQSIDQGISLESLMDKVARHYLQRAMEAAGGNKTTAAKTLGLSSYQTLTNWLRKYEIDQDWHDSR